MVKQASLSGEFGLLHEVIQRALLERGFTEPTEVQRLAIPRILEGRNVLIIGPTGSGKTEAAVLPVLSRLREGIDEGEYSEPGIYVLYITPLRALNRDLLDRLSWWGERVGIRVDVRHGDTDQTDRQRQSRNPPHMLITTPETLQAILSGRRLRAHLGRLRWIIIDEVHELAEDKRGTQLSLALERIKWLIGRKPQIIGLSATVGSPEDVARFLVGNDGECVIVQFNAVREMILDVLHPEPTPQDEAVGKELYLYPDAMARLRVMRSLIEGNGATIIFVNTRSMAELLMYRFSLMDGGDSIGIHHSSLSKVSRIGTERAFKEGKLKAIVATSSLELGIDIGRVDLVVQYLSPHQVVRFLQRIGRSGHRLDKVPRGVIITEDLNDTLEAIVITNRARRGLLEPTQIPEKPYDVLVHQIVAMLMMKSRWRLDEMYKLVSNSYPYRGLSIDELRGVLRFMSEVLTPRLAYFIEDEDVVLKPSGARARREFYRYFFDQLSMIPDEKHYLVINQQDEEPIGVLDEAFVAEYGQPGIKFVFRGRVWVLQRIIGDTIYVSPARDPVGAIPSWIGEEIPVPYDVAQEVGLLKGILESMVRSRDPPDVLSRRLGVSRETVEYVLARVKDQVESGKPVPTDKLLLVERVGDLVIIHTHGGTLVNRTLARLLGDLLSTRLGYPVGVQQDAYAIVLQLPRPGIPTGVVVDALLELGRMSEGEYVNYAVKAITRTGIFKRKFIHVARRFNVIRKDREVSDVSLSSLIEVYNGTPVYTEALKEVLTHDFDLDTTALFLRRLVIGELEVRVVEDSELSPMGKEIADKISHRLELMAPEKLDKLIREGIKARLLNDSNTIACLSCGWVSVVRNKELPERPRCPSCGSGRIGVARTSEEKVRQILQRLMSGRPRSEDEDVVRLLEESSRLVESYGRLAVLALSSKLRLNTIASILSRTRDLDELAQLIHVAEREELKRRFME